jgi:outer membrane protein assembly factor BamB
MSTGARRGRTALAAVAAATLAAAGCWVAPGQGANRAAFNAAETSINADTVATLEEAWTNTGTPPVLAPLSQGGIVFAPVGGFFFGGVRAIDMATGTTRWQLLPTPEFDEVAGTALLDGGRLWLGTGNGRLGSFRPFAVNAATGAGVMGAGQLTGLPEALRGDTLALHGGVFQPFPPGAFGGNFVTVGGTDGTVTWTGFVDFDIASVPLPAFLPLTLGPDFVYLSTNGSLATAPGDTAFGTGMRAYPVGGPSAQNCGRPDFDFLACPAWATPLDGTPAPAVISDDGTLVYAGTDAGTLYALDAATGAVAWTSDIGAPILAPPATAYGRLYVPAADGRLVVLPAAGCGTASCSALATGDAGSGIGVQPGVAGGVVVTGSEDGSLHAFPADCTGACPVRWSAETGSTITGAPAIDGGHLLVGTADGRAIAFAPAA